MAETEIKLSADRLVAHRGQLRNYPENSLAALRAAAAAGARAVEIDVQLSADRVPMLYHDTDLRRISGREGKITGINRDALVKIPAHEPARLGNLFHDTCIAPLSELTIFLGEHPGMTCFVEMKPHSIKQFGVKPCWQALSKILAPVQKQCIFISFSMEFVIEVKVTSACRVGVIVNAWEQLQQLGKKQVDCAFCDTKLLPAAVDLRRLAVPVVVYEVSTAKEARRWLSQGANLVETHDIARLLDS